MKCTCPVSTPWQCRTEEEFPTRHGVSQSLKKTQRYSEMVWTGGGRLPATSDPPGNEDQTCGEGPAQADRARAGQRRHPLPRLQTKDEARDFPKMLQTLYFTDCSHRL